MVARLRCCSMMLNCQEVPSIMRVCGRSSLGTSIPRQSLFHTCLMTPTLSALCLLSEPRTLGPVSRLQKACVLCGLAQLLVRCVLFLNAWSHLEHHFEDVYQRIETRKSPRSSRYSRRDLRASSECNEVRRRPSGKRLTRSPEHAT